MAYNCRKKRQGDQQERLRFPRDDEIVGVVDEMLGGSRFRITCQDGNVRICRVSGKFRKMKELMLSGNTDTHKLIF